MVKVKSDNENLRWRGQAVEMEGSRQILETVEVASLELGEWLDCIPLG